MAVVITLGLVQYSGCGDQGPTETQAPIVPVARLNDSVVSLSRVEDRFNQAAAAYLAVEGGAPIDRVAEVYATALDEELRLVAQREIARKHGAKVSAQAIMDQAGKQFDERVAMQRTFLTTMGQLKPNATEAEVQAELAKSLGVPDIAKARADNLKQVEEMLQKAETRLMLEDQAIGPILIETVSSKTNITDEELVKLEARYITKRVAFSPYENPDAEPMKEAERVLAEIKAGMAFEAAMDKYSDDPIPTGKKKKSEATTDLTRGTLNYDPAYKPLLELKPGEVSPIINLPTGPAIFKLIRIDEAPPANFETSKGDLRKTQVRLAAAKSIRDEIENLLSSDSLKWESEGFKLLHTWLKTSRDPALAGKEDALNTKLEEIADEAKSILEAGTDDLGGRAAQLAYFAAIDKVYDDADDKAAFEERWLEAASMVLETNENVDLRLEIAEVLIAQKDVDRAGETLTMAALSNAGYSEQALENYAKVKALRAKLAAAGLSEEKLAEVDDAQDQWKSGAVDDLIARAEYNEDYTQTGVAVNADITRTLARYVKEGLATAEQAATIRQHQDRWRKSKVEYDDEMAREAQRQRDELKKAEEEAKKTAGENSSTKTGDANPPSSSDLLNPTKGG